MMDQPSLQKELSADPQSRQTLDNLIKRLHQLFVAGFDSKSFDLYIEPQVKDRETGVEFSAFKRLDTFIVQPNAASMLLAGDPGMGKTLLSLQIAQHAWYLFIQENRGNLLKDNYWADVLAEYERQDFARIVAPLEADEKADGGEAKQNISLPLWLWMPFLRTEKNWEQQLLETHLKQSGIVPQEIALLQQACQQRVLHLLPIMDGWDELPPIKENLYLLNGFWEEERWPCVKILSTCRPEAFVHYEKIGGYKSVFHPKPGAGEYTILNLSSFESRHIAAYIDRYVFNLPPEEQPAIVAPAPSAVSAGRANAWDQAKAAWLADYESRYSSDRAQEAVSAGRANAWDQAKAAWIADYESRYSNDRAQEIEEKKDDDVVVVDIAPLNQPIDWRKAQTYQYHLEHIPGLAQLVQTPFILSAVVQVLPRIVMHQTQQGGQSQQAITRYTIYQHFVDYWLATQARRLWRDPKKQLDLIDFRSESDEESIQKIKACLFTYSENLARLALNLGGGKVEVNLSDKDTLNPNLVIPSPGQAAHFAKEPVEEKKLQLIRSGCLLQNLGSTFKFLHKSLVEFFAAKTLFSGAHIAADSYLQRFDMQQSLHSDLSLNEQLLTSEPNIIHLLADQARDDVDFKYLLYQIIELSKGEPSVEKAAANAITILNAAGESFSGRDFRGIHIRGAILNGAVCDQTDYEGADLRDVTAHNAWFQKANLSHAQVSGLDFQELPRIKHSAEITSFCLASHGEWLLVGDMKGYVTQYSYPAGKKLQQWYFKGNASMAILLGNPVLALTLHPEERLVACGGVGGNVQLIHIQGGKWGAPFVPHFLEDFHFSQINYYQCQSITFCHTQGQYLVNLATEYCSYLELWHVKKHRFLGEYVGSDIKQLSTCNQGYTLVANSFVNILLFFIQKYEGGPLVPTQKLDGGNHFALSRDEKLLALIRENSIQLYQTSLWEPLPHTLPLKKESGWKSFAFSPQGNLLAGRSSTQLHIWDLSSGQHLYALPIPEAVSSKEVRIHSMLHFLPWADLLRVLVSASDTLYIWPLGSATASIVYPRHPVYLSTLLLGGKLIPTSKIDTPSLSIQVNSDHGVYGAQVISNFYQRITVTLQIENKLRQESRELSYKFWGSGVGSTPELSLNRDQSYLVTAVDYRPDDLGLMLGSKMAQFVMNRMSDTVIRVWDLNKYCLHFEIKHSCPNLHYLFSTDGRWLVNASQEIFIHRLWDGKKMAEFTTGAPVSVLALSADKNRLIVADYKSCLSVFDVTTQRLLFHINGLPIIIRELELTEDFQFLIASGDKVDELTFRVIQDKKYLTLQLINNTIELNLVCGEVNIEAARGLSRHNQLLLEQNNAHGTPAARITKPVVVRSEEAKELDPPHLVENSSRFRFSVEMGERASAAAQSATAVPPETKESEQEEQIDIGREFSFDRAVVIRDNVDSFLNHRAGLSYGLWQVALVRDAKANNNSEHTFILVEGMDAFGRCFFWRFDLATTIRVGKKVEEVKKGFAKVVMETQKLNNLMLSEREGMLKVFLNPHDIQGRGLESLVGHVWQLKREKVLDLHHAIAADKAKGLLPYAATGNQSFFGGGGDNCYSWARRHLLALKEPKIQADLPSKGADYFVMRPKWKLQDSLTAAEQARGTSTPTPESCLLM